MNGYVDYDRMILGNNVVVTILSSIIGCFVFFLIGRTFFTSGKLVLILKSGEYSIGILGLHVIFTQSLRWLYKLFLCDTIPLWYLLLISIIAFYVSYSITLVIMKLDPRLLGKAIDKN